MILEMMCKNKADPHTTSWVLILVWPFAFCIFQHHQHWKKKKKKCSSVTSHSIEWWDLKERIALAFFLVCIQHKERMYLTLRSTLKKKKIKSFKNYFECNYVLEIHNVAQFSRKYVNSLYFTVMSVWNLFKKGTTKSHWVIQKQLYCWYSLG